MRLYKYHFSSIIAGKYGQLIMLYLPLFGISSHYNNSCRNNIPLHPYNLFSIWRAHDFEHFLCEAKVGHFYKTCYGFQNNHCNFQKVPCCICDVFCDCLTFYFLTPGHVQIYGWQAGSLHDTGMLSCFAKKFLLY